MAKSTSWARYPRTLASASAGIPLRRRLSSAAASCFVRTCGWVGGRVRVHMRAHVYSLCLCICGFGWAVGRARKAPTAACAKADTLRPDITHTHMRHAPARRAYAQRSAGVPSTPRCRRSRKTLRLVTCRGRVSRGFMRCEVGGSGRGNTTTLWTCA